MSNVNEILSSIMLGRFVAERARADHLARALSEVEDLVRELRPTADGVVIEGGNTADLADLAKMQDILDGQGYAPTSAGLYEMLDDLNEALELARNARNQHDEIAGLRSEVKRLRQNIETLNNEHERVRFAQNRLWLEAQDSIGQRQRDNAALRAQIAALTPGPWRTVAEEAPPRGEWIVVVMADGCAYTAQLSENQPIDWMRCWRRLPAGLLDVPAPTVAP